MQLPETLPPSPDNSVRPKRRDGMPYPVATSLLTAPKAKLTARVRRNCRAAREIVYPSQTPLRRNSVGGLETITLNEEVQTRKLAGYSVAQLTRWIRRTVARRRVVQKTYELLPLKEEKKRRQLELLAQVLDVKHDILLVELARRASHPVRVIDPAVLRRQKKVAQVA